MVHAPKSISATFGKHAGRKKHHANLGNVVRVLVIVAILVVVLAPFYISFLYSS